MSDRPPRDRWLLILGFAYPILALVFILFKTVVPSVSDGWSTIPAVDLLFILACLLSMLGMSAGLSYRAWTMNADEFSGWLVAQQLFGASWTRFQIEFFSKEWYLWWTRLLGPVVVAVVLSVLILYVSGMFAGRIPSQ